MTLPKAVPNTDVALINAIFKKEIRLMPKATLWKIKTIHQLSQSAI